jgi:hypothetical protein
VVIKCIYSYTSASYCHNFVVVKAHLWKSCHAPDSKYVIRSWKEEKHPSRKKNCQSPNHFFRYPRSSIVTWPLQLRSAAAARNQKFHRHITPSSTPHVLPLPYISPVRCVYCWPYEALDKRARGCLRYHRALENVVRRSSASNDRQRNQNVQNVTKAYVSWYEPCKSTFIACLSGGCVFRMAVAVKQGCQLLVS